MARASMTFLQGEGLLELAQLADIWHCRPSTIVELDGVLAYQIDLACAVVLSEWRAARRQQQGAE